MLAAVHWIVTVCPAVNVPEVGPVSVKLGAAARRDRDRRGEVGDVTLAHII